MTETHHPHARRRRCLTVLGLLGALMLGCAGVASAATKVIRYHGYHATVPASWPVFRLAQSPRTCVRFNRHAVYLGRPGADQLCPPDAAGRTEAILVSPLPAGHGVGAAGTVLAPTIPGAASARGSAAQTVKPAAHVVVTATWNRDPSAVADALGVRSVLRAGRGYDRRQTAGTGAGARSATTRARSAVAHARRAATVTSPGVTFPVGTVVGTPGSVYTGLGFDACSTPSTTAMSAWTSSPFRAVGVYIGGANMACSQPNLTATWVTTETDAGWHLIPIYVGLQAPSNGCGCATISPAAAAAQGSAAALDAISHAAAIGLGPGNPIYFDMENYTRSTSSTATVLAFLSAWTTQLHLSGYLSGIYGSNNSGIEDLVAEQGTGYVEPDDIWFASWNGQQSTANAELPATDWANHQRLHQFEGGHVDDYGGSQIDIDGDYVDAATASAGSGSLTTTIAAAPTLSVRPVFDGTIDLNPSWSGEPGVASWQISAGAAATTLTPVKTIAAGAKRPIVLRSSYPYFQAEALNALGQPIGATGVVATPAHVALFGNSAFVPPHGPGGVPVACYGLSPCQVSATVTVGHRRMAHTGLESIPAGGGTVHFDLSRADHRIVAKATGHRLPVTVTVRTSTGARASRPMSLVPFTVSGRAPRTTAGVSPSLRILSETGFVSHGWSGGVLAVCLSATPCLTSTTLTERGQLIAQSQPQTLGVGELGYLSFRMTRQGHRLLSHALGNQLGARVTVTTSATTPTPATGAAAPGATTSALISLASF